MDQNVTTPVSIFGMHVFGRKEMKDRLPADVYKRLMTALDGKEKLDASLADYVAAAMKEWALSLGATHYAHWFQPRTEVTAERHMAFLDLDEDGSPIHTFSGKELIRSEPDASSFPNGGMRDTFEARGYCAWDPSSPAFIVTSHKGGTLCIPSVFFAYDGTPLDMKTPLLKSINAIQERALRLLKLFGNRTVRSVDVTIGAEQEYFLIDEEKASKRPDIELCRRTVIGAPSPKAQTAEAHYFGSIPHRVLAFMEDVERDMNRLGEVLMTRHNEVAPCQFEFAPVLAEANLGCDHNQMLMEVMRKMARRHKFQLLLHEKPFASVNGSGKHLNVSLRDSEGRNLLKPTNNPRRNLQFYSFICALLLGVQHHGGLLRACISSAGNAHRLGGHEAPPAIMSIYVGSLIDHVLSNMAKGVDEDVADKKFIDLGLDRLPCLDVDASDRNRTSPIAFTGNKWEFRAVGAPQALGGPLTALLAIWSEGIESICDALEAKISAGADVMDAAIEVLKDAWTESAPVRFEGNGYDPSWIDEAKRRGLPICENTVDALDQYLIPEHKSLLTKLGIMSDREVEAYYEVRIQQFSESQLTDIGVLRSMMYEGVLPAITAQIKRESDALDALPESVLARAASWKKNIETLANLKCDILDGIEKLDELVAGLKEKDEHTAAKLLAVEAVDMMQKVRDASDTAEGLVAKDLWPYPTYKELFKIED